MSFDRLIRKIVETKNPTVVGLDPKLEYIPEELKAEAYAKYGKTLEGAAEAILLFNLRCGSRCQAPVCLLRAVRLAGHEGPG